MQRDRDVGEDELPGIGRRYSVACDDGGVLTIVIHNGGRRDLYVTCPDGGDPANVSMDEWKARAVAGIIAGAHIFSQGDDSFLLDLAVKQKDASPFRLSCGFEAVSLPLGDRTH